MTEEPEPLPVPLPLVQPGMAAPRNPWPRRLLIGCGISLVIAALAGCSVFGAWFARSLYENRDVAAQVAPVTTPTPYVPAETAPSPPMSEAKPKVAWFGADRYLAIQISRDTLEGTKKIPVPQVIVWDRESGESTVIGDYVLVGAERAYPRLYLSSELNNEANSDLYSGMTERPPLDQYDDMCDDLSYEFVAWTPDGGTTVLDAEEVTWSPWIGPGGRRVDAVIDTGNASAPVNLYFTVGDERIPVDATGFLSCEPIGWSPSGKYFAVATLLDPWSEYYQQFDELEELSMIDSIQNHVVVFSTATGEAVYDVPLGTVRAASVSGTIMWDASSDLLYHQVLNSPKTAPFTKTAEAKFIAVDLTSQTPVARTLTIPATWSPGDWQCLGTQKDSARVVREVGFKRTIWRVSKGTITEEGTLDMPVGASPMSASRDGALAWLSPVSLDDASPMQCTLSDSIFGSTRVIWKDK